MDKDEDKNPYEHLTTSNNSLHYGVWSSRFLLCRYMDINIILGTTETSVSHRCICTGFCILLVSVHFIF